MIHFSHCSSTKTCRNTKSFPCLMAVYAIRWLSESRECLTDVLVTTLSRKASLTMSFLLMSHFASKWRTTHWTSCLIDLIVVIVSAQSRWDEIGLIFSFFAEDSGEVILTGTQPGIGCKYPILNRPGNDGTSSGKSNGGYSLPPCTCHRGWVDFQQVIAHSLAISTEVSHYARCYSGEESSIYQRRYLNVHELRF